MAPHLKAYRLRLVLLDIRIDDAGDVVLVLLDLLEQTVVFLFLVFDFFEFFRFGGFLGRGGFAFFAFFSLGVGLDCGFGLDDFLLGLVFGRRLFDLLVLGLFRFLVFGFGHHGLRRLRHARAALLQQHFGLKSEGAFRTFDRTLL